MLELYKNLVIDHGLNPRNKYILKDYNHHAKGYNTFCGDTVSLYLYITKKNIIENISFDGSGCSISIASASIATCILKNRKSSAINDFYTYLQTLLQNTKTNNDEDKQYKEINILSNVKYFPSRIKCANLAWHVLIETLNKKKDII
ncbi:MAG: SUF system NifU family Fe-S cluster assembly protein [Candidatus Riesia sp.]|nr:SUF system NifU family Fe-S cluster assembly protein [Candidatus Riesia sp.]